MVGLPSVENREKILRTLLAKEKVEDLDFKELATMTEGYSGSDLKVRNNEYKLVIIWQSLMNIILLSSGNDIGCC